MCLCSSVTHYQHQGLWIEVFLETLDSSDSIGYAASIDFTDGVVTTRTFLTRAEAEAEAEELISVCLSQNCSGGRERQ